MAHPMILVTGATGKSGRAAVHQLDARSDRLLQAVAVRLRTALGPTLAGAVLLGLQACKPVQSAADPRTEARLVRVVQVAPAPAPERSFTGVVAARVQSDLGFRVAGKVVERLVDAGQTVQAGPAADAHRPHRPGARHRRAGRQRRRGQGARWSRPRPTRSGYRALVPAGAGPGSTNIDQARAAADSARAAARRRRGAGAAWPRTTAAMPCCSPTRTAPWSRHWPSPARWSPPARRGPAGPCRRARGCRQPARNVCARRSDRRPPPRSSARTGAAVSARLRQLSQMPPIRATRTFEARYVLDGAGRRRRRSARP